MQIRQLAASQQIVCRDVTTDEYGETLGALCGFPDYPKRYIAPSAVTFSEEMMVFGGFEQVEIYQFLSAYKAAKIDPVWLKASLTKHNVQWNSLQLYDELSKEHRQINSTS